MTIKVGAIIRQARESAGISQEELAKQAGTGQSAVCRIEKDRQSPSLRVLEALAFACGKRLTISLDPLGPDPAG